MNFRQYLNLTSALAIYAAILATITAVVQLMNFLRDRRDVKVSFRRETEYFEEHGFASVGETVTVVTVANAGRRPVTIINLRALRLFPRGGYVELASNPAVPVELKENQRLVAWAYDEQVDLAEVEAFEVRDALDNPYRKNVAPWYSRIGSQLRRLLRP